MKKLSEVYYLNHFSIKEELQRKMRTLLFIVEKELEALDSSKEESPSTYVMEAIRTTKKEIEAEIEDLRGLLSLKELEYEISLN